MDRDPSLDDTLLPSDSQPVTFRQPIAAQRAHSLRAADPRAKELDTFEQRYESRELLGEGGMGEVRLAHDLRIGREVAVKTVRPLLGVHGEERFVREARVQGQLEHPAVVPVYDLGATAEGRVYFTMKRIRGRSLDSIIAALAAGDPASVAQLSRRRLLTAFTQVCLAVEYAHARGVLHRDLKPGNVMIGDFGEVHLLDWGLAKVRGADDADAPALSLPGPAPDATLAGSSLGTPGYMAPEQAHGDLDRVDERSDVYALGVILFELLFLEPLHGQPTSVARMTATITGPEPPMDSRPRAGDVPPELAAIIARATQIDRDARYGSARELAGAVERYRDGERDEARRRELAQAHVERARALANDAPRKVEALRELGRALALDPTHASALRALEELLSTLPDEVPAEAKEELASRAMVRQRSVLRASAVRSVAWLVAIPVVIAFGILDWTRAGIGIALLLANAAVSFLATRARDGERAILTVLVVSSLCIASFSFLLGPLVLVPGFAATNAMMFALAAGPRVRNVAIALSIASFALPMGASAIGLDAAYYTSTALDSITITSPMSQLPLTGTLLFMLGALAALIVTPTVLAGRLHDRLADAERRVFLQAFHLRQLLPRGDEAERSAS